MALEAAADTLHQRARPDRSGALTRLALGELVAAPAEIAIRVLEGLLVRHGGQEEPPGLQQIEALHDALLGAAAGPGGLTSTLGGCVVSIDAAGKDVLVWREMRGGRLPEVAVGAGQRVIWDLRYRVIAGLRLNRSLVVGAIGANGWRMVTAERGGFEASGAGERLPVAAAATLPGLYRDGVLVAVPSVGWRMAGAQDCDVQVEVLTLAR
jgi:hypothetical protein